MADITDRAIERLLREVLQAEAESLPLRVRPEDVRLHGNERRRQRTRRRLGLPLLVAAGLLVPLGLAWAIGSSPEPDEGQRYQAVLVRGLDRHDDGSATDDLEVVLADADGSVQPLRRMPASRFPAQGGIWNPALSTQGWLTFSTQVGDGPEPTDVLLDLADPDRAPTLLPGWSRTGWAPDGSLWRESTGTELIDPETGTRTSVEREDGADLYPLPLGSWSLATTIDGELVVSAPPDPVDGEPTLPRTQAWGGIDADGRLTLAIRARSPTVRAGRVGRSSPALPPMVHTGPGAAGPQGANSWCRRAGLPMVAPGCCSIAGRSAGHWRSSTSPWTARSGRSRHS